MMNIHARLYQIAKSNFVRFAAIIALASPIIVGAPAADAGKRNNDNHQKSGQHKGKADRGDRQHRADNRRGRDADRHHKQGPDHRSGPARNDRPSKHSDKMRDHRPDHPQKHHKSNPHDRPKHGKKHPKHKRPHRPDHPKKHTKMKPPPHHMPPMHPKMPPPDSQCDDTLDYRYVPGDIRYREDCDYYPEPRKKHHYVKHHYGHKKRHHRKYSHRKHGYVAHRRMPVVAYGAPAVAAPYQMPTVTHRAPYEHYVDGGSVVSDLQRLKSSIASDFSGGNTHRVVRHHRKAKPSAHHRKHRGHRVKKHHRTRSHNGRMYKRVVGVKRKTIRCVGYPGQLETVRCEKVRTEFIPRKGRWSRVGSGKRRYHR